MQQNVNLYKLPSAIKISNKINPLIEKCIQQMKCSELFINKTQPFMIKLIEQLLQDQPQIPLLIQSDVITLSRTIVFTLLSMMYFEMCLPQTLPNIKFPPYYNFAMCQGTQLEKLKCFINYFNQCVQNQEYFNLPDIKIEKLSGELKFSEDKLSNFSFASKKNEDHINCGIVDFSDQFFGGKVVASRGCAQEEVILLINPEAVVATLLTSQIKDDEALQIHGIMQFNDYRGYEDSFVCIPQKYQQKNQILIAIDALYLASQAHNYQYSKEGILREIKKAYIGFKNCKIVSTGKWGCGLYGGDKQLKTLIQWIAFSQANNDGTIIFNGLDDKSYINMGQRLEQIKKRYVTIDKLINELLKVNSKNILDRL